MMNAISKQSTIGANVSVGNYTTIEDNCVIGDGCVIGHNVTIREGSVIGGNVRIDDNAVIGKHPMRAANSAVTKEQELEAAQVGANCIIGTSAIIYRGCQLGQKVLVADLATVRENVTVGDFTIIGRGVAVENFCTIGTRCKLETNVYLTAYSTVEDYCFLAPGVVTSNDNFMGRTEERFKHFKGVVVKKGGRIGVNATILPGKIVAEDTVVAAGALLTRDAEPKTIYAGMPAKSFREVPAEELLDNQKK